MSTNTKAIETLAPLLTNESKLVFANGQVVEGAEQVTRVILGACEAYNKGYLQAYNKKLMRGFVTGMVIGGIYLMYQNTKRKELQKETQDNQAL